MGNGPADRGEVAVAFATLLTALDAEIQQLSRAGVAAYEAAEPDDVQRLVRAAEQAASLRQRLVVLQHEWRALASVSNTSDARPEDSRHRRYYGRLPAGVPTPRAAYRAAVLLALIEQGGEAAVEGLMPAVEARMQDHLQPIDYLSVASRPKTPRWRNAVHAARLDLLRDGLLAGDSPRGLWTITSAGRAAAATASADGPVLPLDA